MLDSQPLGHEFNPICKHDILTICCLGLGDKKLSTIWQMSHVEKVCYHPTFISCLLTLIYKFIWLAFYKALKCISLIQWWPALWWEETGQCLWEAHITVHKLLQTFLISTKMNPAWAGLDFTLIRTARDPWIILLGQRTNRLSLSGPSWPWGWDSNNSASELD